MPPPPCLNHLLPSHLAEICDILARGLVRLREREREAQSRQVSEQVGETPLHFAAHQRRHANRTNRRLA